MFFSCSLAKFAWSVTRQLLGCKWCPASFAQAFAIFSGLPGQTRRQTWILFIAQCWALWLIRNNFTLQARFIKHPADVIFKTSFYKALAPTVQGGGQSRTGEVGGRTSAHPRGKPSR